MSTSKDEVLTLEPLIEAVREGVEARGWELSGLQKTTSHHFEGRWTGDSTRSAYLFFHRASGPDWASLDVYLDETTRGLSGDLALVVDGRTLSGFGGVSEALETLARLAGDVLPEGYRRPLTVRFRLDAPHDDPAGASSEIRFKLRLPKSALDAGRGALAALASATAASFNRLLADPRLEAFLD